MALESSLHILRGELANDSKILHDRDTPDFKTSSQRWSSLGMQTPGAIIKPVNEADVLRTIEWAHKASIPFVLATGGHSYWSTIDEDGFILDLSLYKDVVVDSSNSIATIKGGVLMKELQVALSKEGRLTPVGNGSTVGAIPYFLNGGINVYYPLLGFACENIISAKLGTATGDVVEVNDASQSDLLWAIRGAGQFFGVVLELVIRTYPFSLLGNLAGSRQLGTYIFAPHQITDVCRAMSEIIKDRSHVSAGQIMIANAPSDHKKQVLLVTRQSFGSEERSTQAFQPLLDLGPINYLPSSSTFETHSDQLDWQTAHGGLKTYSLMGLENFHQENFIKLLDLHSKVMAECPGAEHSALTFQWHSPRQKLVEVDTAFGNGDVSLWFNVLGWYTDASQHEKIVDFDRAAQTQMRMGTEQSAFISYANTNRDDPIEYRYKGDRRLAKLKALKRKWDPTGVFTKELL